jgi:predicted NUDIX family NTP pyrophosphohydrolase
MARAQTQARSAGLLLYRDGPDGREVLLVHPGGPFWTRRDRGAWSIPKGACGPDEEPLAAAKREFEEELGTAPPVGDMLDLGEITQRGGKRVLAWGLLGDLDVSTATSNTFAVEWPPRSGQLRQFPEVDRAEWFSVEAAREKINPAQAELIDRLETALSQSRS